MNKIIFSIVIALAPERQAEVLNSIKYLNYPKNKYEVIVEKGINPSDNRNNGSKKANGDFIAFIDDDALVDKNLLKNAEAFFEKYKDIAIVGGTQLTPKDDRGFSVISGYALSCKFGAWKMSNRYSGDKEILDADETMLTSANMFVKRKVMKKIKFNPMLFPGEDPDFIARAKKLGFNVAYSPNLVVYHRRRSTFSSLIKQIYKYGKTRPKKEKLKETLKMPFFIIPSLFLIYLVFLIIFFSSTKIITGSVIGNSSINQNISLLFFLPLILYLILNLSFSLFHSLINKNIKVFFILPLVYLSIHLSYGAGFLISSLKKLGKK